MPLKPRTGCARCDGDRPCVTPVPASWLRHNALASELLNLTGLLTYRSFVPVAFATSGEAAIVLK